MSETVRYMEDALDYVKDYMVTNLDNSLDVIEGERSEDVPKTGAIEVGESETHKFPRIEVLPDRTDHDYGYEEQPLTEPWLIHHIYVWITHSWVDKDALRKVLMRYVEAINRITQADDTYGGAFVDVRLGTEDYTPLMQSQESKTMMQGVSIEVECRTR